MRVWKVASGAVAVLAVAALAVAWAPAVSGQQPDNAPKKDAQERRIVVREQGPIVVREGGAHLGVAIRNVTADDVTKLKLPGPSGVIVDDVAADTPAAKGGALKGDVIVTFDGESVRSVMQFMRLVREAVPGRAVKMSVVRDGKRLDLSVAPDEARNAGVRTLIDEKGLQAEIEKEIERVRPEIEQFRWQPRAAPGPPAGPMGPMNRFWYFNDGAGPNVFNLAVGRGRLGVTVQGLTPELAEFFGVKDGALVTAVEKDRPAAKAGIKAGDVITAVDGKSVAGPTELVDQLREKSGDVSVTVQRDKKPLTLKAVLEKPETPKPRVMMHGIPG
jgi:S1-C subfamily serine protease